MLIILLVGALVSLLFGVYASVHDPTGETTIALFFSNTVSMKVWFTTAALVFAILQVLTALRLYGKVKIPKTFPKWLPDAHRLFGTLAFLLSLPVAFHCLWSFGFESTSSQTRRYVHSVAGCLFYGAFASKVLAVRTKRLAGLGVARHRQHHVHAPRRVVDDELAVVLPKSRVPGLLMFKRIVAAVEVVAVVGFVVMVALLLLKQPTKNLTALPATNFGAGGSDGRRLSPPDGAAVSLELRGLPWRRRRWRHRPQLRDGAVTSSFKDAASEVSFVKSGAGGMPAFRDELSEAEIQAIVDFTRTTLQSK